MGIFKYRNLALGCAGFLITLYLCYYLSAALAIFVASVCIITAAALWIAYCKGKSKRLLNVSIKYTPLLILITLAIIISTLTFVNDKEDLKYCDNTLHTVSGKVEAVNHQSEYFSVYIAKLNEIDGEKKNLSIVLYENGGTLLENYDFTATLKFGTLENKELGFDAANYYLDNGIILMGNIGEFKHVSQGSKDFIDNFKDVNLYLDNIFKKSLNSDTYPIVSALFLGNRHLLSDSLNRDFSRVGIVHILSLGGMHVSIIITMLGFAISRLNIKGYLQILLTSIAILFFVGITGFSETAMRAGIMQLIFYFIFFLWSKADSITSLFVAVSLICAFAPYLIFSLSLMLSFFSMLGCICSAKMLFKSRLLLKVKFKPLRFIILTAATTIGVTFMALPLTFIHFGTVSLVAIPANILIVPILNILIYLAPCILILSPVPYVCDFLAYICQLICKITTTVCHFLSNLRGICLDITGSIQLVGVIFIFISCLIMLILPKRGLKLSFSMLLVSIFVFTIGTGVVFINRRNNFYITTYTGDAVVVESDNTLTYIDISDHESALYPNDLCSYIGYTEIDSYVSLSYSSRLPNYLDRLTDNAIVRKVYLSKPFTENETKYYDACVDVLESKGIECQFSDELEIKDVSLTICSDSYISRSTKRAVVFSLLMNNTRYTYLGASSFELGTMEPALLASASDILAFGSYGPKYEVSYYYNAPFLEYILFMGNSKDYAEKDMLSCANMETYSPLTIRIKK